MLARRLAAEVESELSSLGALEAELASAPPGDDTYALRARGSILHDFYNGIERVFVRIARELKRRGSARGAMAPGTNPKHGPRYPDRTARRD